MYTIKSMLKRILKYTRKYRFMMFTALFSAIVFVGCMLFSPILVGQKALNLFKDSDNFNTHELHLIINYLFILIIVSVIFGLLMGILLNKVTYKVVLELRNDAFNKILNVPVSYLDRNLHGDILARVITDTEDVADGLLHGFEKAFTGIITIIVTVGFMLVIRWQIALVVILLTPLSMIMAYLISKFSFKTFKEEASVKGEMSSLINEMISEQKTVLAYNLVDENIEKYESINNRLYKIGGKSQFIASLVNPCTRFVNSIVYASVALIGTLYILKKPSVMEVGMLSVFLSYASQYTKPFNEISSVAAELSSSFASLRRVFILIDEKEIKDESNLPDIVINDGNYELSDVSFSYYKDKPLLNKVNIKVNKGMKVAIVGPTGCGKTTLINLLMRYYDIDSGKILIDGNNIYDFNRKSLRDKVGMVLQETWLFKGSVYDNIRYAKSDATNEEIIEASKRAYCHDFIMKLPNGYDTIISDNSGVSIGEKQLLCIARLMLKLPDILILDEATSNIDTRTEIKIQKAFNDIMKGRTSFVIAHRLSTIRNSSIIIVMNSGNIIEVGNHEELLNKKGFYYKLYNSQFEK